MVKTIFKKVAASFAVSLFLMASIIPTASAGGSIGTPEIVTPVQNQVITTYPRTLNVWWGSVTGATSYELEVACDFCSSSTVKWSNPNSYKTRSMPFLVPALPGDNQYRVRVRGVGTTGDTGQWSNYVYFSFDTSPAVNNSVTLKSDPPISSGSYDADNGKVFVKVGDKVNFYTTITGVLKGYEWKWDASRLNCSSSTPKLLSCESVASGSAAVWFNADFSNQAISSNVIYVNSTEAYITPTKPTVKTPWVNEEFNHYPRITYLSWTSVSGAESYDLEVACDVCTSTTTKWLNPSKYTTENTFYKTPPLAGDNEFRFRVRGVNKVGAKGQWSDYRYFRYKTPPTTTSSDDIDLNGPDTINLYISEWTGVAPLIKWTAYTKGSFDGYAMFVRQGTWDKDKVTWTDASHFSKSKTSHQLVKILTNTDYTVRIVPYKNGTNGAKYSYIYPASNVIHFTTGDNVTSSSSSSSNAKLPPAGYEDKVLTNPSQYQNPFPDTNKYSLEGKSATELYRRGVIGGYSDGTFKGSNLVNRAEAAKFLMLARYGDVDDYKNNGKFWDVLDGQWYTKFVIAAYKFGVINGYENGSFGPGNTVNTAEFLKMLTLTFNLRTDLSYDYNDVSSDAWYAGYAGTAQKYNLFPDRNSKYLEPAKAMTRKEVAIAIYQYLHNR